MRSAVVAGLLDIELLTQSNGAHGLRDLIIDLAKQYGKRRAFPEEKLVDAIVAHSSPTTRTVFDRYVFGTDRPPVTEYYRRLGLGYGDGRFTIDSAAPPQQIRLRDAWLRQ